MKATHILIPLVDWNTFRDDGYEVKDGKWIEKHSPKVDLSEEGIIQILTKFDEDDYYTDKWKAQYAKDLINTVS